MSPFLQRVSVPLKPLVTPEAEWLLLDRFLERFSNIFLVAQPVFAGQQVSPPEILSSSSLCILPPSHSIQVSPPGSLQAETSKGKTRGLALAPLKDQSQGGVVRRAEGQPLNKMRELPGGCQSAEAWQMREAQQQPGIWRTVQKDGEAGMSVRTSETDRRVHRC